MPVVIKRNAFPLLLTLLIIITFLVLQPTSKSSLFSFSNQAEWNNFITDVKTSGRIETKSYWEMREFYSPGQFVFNNEGINSEKQKDMLKSLGIAPKSGGTVILTYTSPQFSSFESLVENKNKKEFLQVIRSISARSEVLSTGENYIIIKTKPDKAAILFVTTYDEMKKANGFYEFLEEDKDLTKEKSWLSVSEVVIK